MIKAVVFDWGGVLIDNPADGLVSYCANALGVSVEVLKNKLGQFEDDFFRGLVTESEIWKKICSDLEIDEPRNPSLWKDAVESVFVDKEDVFGLATKLKENGIKTGFLSNTEIPTMEYFYEKGYDRYFDELVFSCAEKTAKPDEEIFEILLKKLNTQPEETVFIDDKQVYIDGAEKVGIKGILFTDYESMVDKLIAYGVNI